MDADQLDQGADDKDKQDHHDRIRDQKPVFRKCGVSENMTPEEWTYIAVIVDEVNAEGCCGDQIDRRNVRHFDLGKSQKHCDRDQHDRNLMHLIEEGGIHAEERQPQSEEVENDSGAEGQAGIVGFFTSASGVALGEIVVCYTLGFLLYIGLEKSKVFKKLGD